MPQASILTIDKSLPIGVFDSGMGGLTVLAELRRQLPREKFIYLGDTARLPYGTKSAATVVRYATQASDQLVERGVKALVVACNTASGVALDHLARHFAPLPVYGVVEPGAHAAIAAADVSGVLVLATESTIQGGAYQRALLRRSPGLRVYGRACPLWVTLAEQGPQDAPLTAGVLRHYLGGFLRDDAPSTVLLGCTHFPVFAAALAEVLAPHVRVVDSAQTTASAVGEALAAQGLLSEADGDGLSVYLATDGAARFRRVGRHFLGADVPAVELVDL